MQQQSNRAKSSQGPENELPGSFGPGSTKCRYFVLAKGWSMPREWHPPEWDDSWPVDCRYFGLALAEMDRLLPGSSFAPPLHVYITWDARNLPEYGAHVVVLLIGEEYGLIPRYIRHVRAVFKTTRLRPTLGSRRWWKLDHLHFLLWLKYARNWALHLRSRWEAILVPPYWPQRIRERAEVLDVPLGYFGQEALPQKPMRERAFHCFFAGQVEIGPQTVLRKLLPSPKVIARRKMFSTIRRLQRSKLGFRFDGDEVTSSRLGTNNYSERMMNSKICLAPRGTVPDSFRFFEGLRAGCLVVCESLTGESFYVGAPVIQIDDWSDLEQLISPYLENDDALEHARLQALDWWEQKCGEVAVGRAMAATLLKERR